jgi:dolichyl-phosphate beta-glucosyltransferase
MVQYGKGGIMLSVVIPTYTDKVVSDEIGKIFTDMGYDVQVVISTDDPHVGKGNALKEGLKYATGEHILFMDADLQILPQEIKSFFKQMDLYDADAVVGNKHHSYSNIRYTLWRRVVSLVYRTFIQALFHLNIKDTQCGFKLFKREPLLLIADKLMTNRFATDLEIIIALKESGFRVVDAPIYVKKQVNRGSVSLKNIATIIIDTLKIWWLKQKGFYG